MAFDVTEYQTRQGMNPVTIAAMIAFHILSIVALFHFSWSALAVTIFLWWLTGSPGIGMGYHRLLTHRGFKTYKPVEYFLTVCAVLTLEGGPIAWVATHRIHHTHTDHEGDPHSPRDGKWWSHIGWILTGTAQQYPDEVLKRYAPDLWKDPVHRWLDKYYYIPVIICGVLLAAIGGWSWLLWGLFLRTTYGLHATWLVNSATHLWGSRRFQTDDDSRNSWWVALLTFGEGWHNNHHAYPPVAKHGLAWYEVDMNWWGIRFLEVTGLAWDIKRPKATAPESFSPELAQAGD